MKALPIAISAIALTLTSVTFAATAAPDKMGDKTVTRAEAETRARDAFAKLDLNRDGKIDKADREAKMAEHFKKMDSDGNGSISQAEFMASHERKPGGGMGMDHKMGQDMGAPGKEMRGGMHEGMRGGKRGAMMGFVMLRMADTNKDGAVSRDEFVASSLARFDKADTNKDAKVSPEERKAAMKAMRDHMGGMKGKGGMRGMRGPMGDGPPPPPSGN
jgi:hypothetical protein